MIKIYPKVNLVTEFGIFPCFKGWLKLFPKVKFVTEFGISPTI